MADISSLGNLQPVDALDLTEGSYTDAKESSFRLPPAGRYTLKAPDSFPQAAFTRTKAGALQIQIDPTILGGEFDGFQVRFVKVSAKQFDRSGQKVSQLGDYLRACGFRGVLRNEQEQADAVESTAGTVYEANLEWRGYNKNTGYSLEGMKKFPRNADGSYQSWTPDPVETDEKGDKKRVLANLIVAFNGYIPKI